MLQLSELLVLVSQLSAQLAHLALSLLQLLSHGRSTRLPPFRPLRQTPLLLLYSRADDTVKS